MPCNILFSGDFVKFKVYVNEQQTILEQKIKIRPVIIEIEPTD